jgi:predicted RNA-binding protein YlxR (DUF448 family)
VTPVGSRTTPERMCVGCRERAAKGDLLRVVGSGEDGLRVDASGTAPGRGAYLHRRAECVSTAAEQGKLARALRTSLPPEEAARLAGEIRREIEREAKGS